MENFNYQSVPFHYLHCLNPSCARSASCLRHLAAQHVPAEVTHIMAVNPANYPAEADVRAELDKLPHRIVLNVDKVAKEIGSIRVANIVLLGATIPFLGIDYEKIQTSIREIFERKGEAIVEMNLKALAAGKEIAEKLM